MTGDVGIVLQAFGYGGGIERYGVDLVRGLNALGVSPHIYANRVDPSLSGIATKRIYHLHSPLVPRQFKGHYLSARLRRIATKEGVPSLIGCCRNDTGDIAICGGTHRGFLNYMEKTPRLFDLLELRLERRFYAHSRVVVAHSGLMKNELEYLYGIPTDKIQLLYPPVAHSTFGPASKTERARLREALGLPSGEILFLFVSTGHRRKGFDLLWRYFSQSHLPIRLLVAGRPIRGTSEKISYLGYRKDLEQVYRAVDFTIHPSLYEPFGLACMESIKCGTPVIVSNRVGASEVISAGAQLVLPELTQPALSMVIEQALQIRLAMRERAESDPIGYNDDPVDHARQLLALCRLVP